MKQFIFSHILIYFFCLTFFGCYSFTGSSIPKHLKTISIPLVNDESGFGDPTLKEKLTNKLKEKILQDNSLLISDNQNFDSILEGKILSVTNEASVIKAGERVSEKKVVISVSFSFTDKILKKKVWEKTFSNFGVYEINSPIENAIDDAIEKMSEDIILATVSNW